MNLWKTINSGLDRASLVTINIVESPSTRKVSLQIRDLTNDDLYHMGPWEFDVTAIELKNIDEHLSYLCLRLANETLEEFRNED